jgi:antitoxin VapB
MSTHRRAKLFRNGRNQAVHNPLNFELCSEETTLRKEGERLIIEPGPPRSLLAVLTSLETLDDAFPPIPELPNDSVHL